MGLAGTHRWGGRRLPALGGAIAATVAVAVAAVVVLAGSRPVGVVGPGAGKAAGFGRLPIRFEPNLGQAGAPVRFLAHAPGTGLFLTPGEAVLALGSERLRVRWLGAARPAAVSGLERLPGVSNYFLGRATPRTGVPAFGRVRYRGVYPGVDLDFHGRNGRLEYDFTLGPGVDPGVIRLGLGGARQVRIDRAGDLRIRLGQAELVERAPRAYQVVEGARRAVVSRFVLGARDQVAFAVGRHDSARPLVIDPVVVYSSYLGGRGSDVGLGIAVDRAGDAYVTGNTSSPDFPQAGPLRPVNHGVPMDAFVTKLDPTGTAVIYSTYLGGSGYTDGRGIAVDRDGNAYVTGATNSRDFPTRDPMQATYGGGPYDMYVAKIGPGGGALVYSTFAGSPHNDRAYAIAVDARGEAVITGRSARDGFPTAGRIPASPTGGAVVAKLNAAGSAFVYSTVLGGRDFGARENVGFGVAVDAAGNAYVTGGTSSHDFPVVRALQPRLRGVENAFVAKIDAGGDAIDYSTFLGGGRVDFGSAIAVGADGSAFVTGQTTSRNFPTRRALRVRKASRAPGADAFVVELDPRGRSLVYATYIGGSVDSSGAGIAVDRSGRAHVTGYTASGDFPRPAPAHAVGGGARDAFVAVIDAGGSSLASVRRLGGRGDDIGEGVAVGADGATFVTGATASSDYPTVRPIEGPPAKLTATAGGGTSAFVTKLAPVSAGR
jgi:hypothetical protein